MKSKYHYYFVTLETSVGNEIQFSCFVLNKKEAREIVKNQYPRHKVVDIS